MAVYILRHGETEYTQEKRIQGKSHVPLSKSGVKMAEAAARKIRKLGITQIYTSKLKRAIQTADIVNKGLNVKRTKDARINERNYGAWEHTLWSQVYKENPDLRKEWDYKGIDFRPPKGESIREVIERTLDFWREFQKKHKSSEKILIVAHGGPIKIMMGFSKGLHPSRYYKQKFLKPCTLIKVNSNGSVKIE